MILQGIRHLLCILFENLTSILKVASCSKIAAGVPVIIYVFQAEVKEESKKEGTLIPLGKISRYSTHQLHIILGQSDSHTIKPGCTG